MEPVVSKPEGADAGPVDVDAILAKTDIHPQFKKIYDRAVLSGMRIMFDKKSHPMVLKYLDGEGELADKIAKGVVGVLYMLWDQSNKTLPPQILVPVVFTLTLKAFDFLQKSDEPGATKEVLGDAVEKGVTRMLEEFGATPEQIPQILGQLQQAMQTGKSPGAPPDPKAVAEAAKPGLLEDGGAP